jgi:hypothetical protein
MHTVVGKQTVGRQLDVSTELLRCGIAVGPPIVGGAQALDLLFAALTTLSQGKAYTLTLSSYVEAVKQVEILFAMAIGVMVFGETRRVRESALGAAVMLTGMVLLALAR